MDEFLEKFLDTLTTTLTEEMNCKTVFTIPVFGGIEVAESVVVTWGIMLFLFIGSFILTRNLKTRNVGTVQVIAESIVDFLTGLVKGFIGEKGNRYVTFLSTILLFIGIANITGLVGVKPPTKDMNVTAALAVIAIVLIEFAGIRARGVKGWMKSFFEPVAIMFPINVLELAIRPLSLCMRLFGNVLGAFVIMELLKVITHAIIPAAFSLYFDVFDGLIQAYVFVFLTSLYMKEAIE